MKMIVAVDREWGIGNKGQLLARVRADLMNFKRETLHKVVVCGSNTVATFPGGRALKDRVSIVLHPDKDYVVENAVVVHSIPELLEETKKYDTNDVYIIGGASVYNQMLPYCDTAIVTKFDKSFEKDVYIKDLDKDAEWECVSSGQPFTSDGSTDTEPDLICRFTLYKRKRQ